MGKLTNMRNQREDIVKRLTSCLQGGETRTALFAVFRGERTKEEVFGELLGRLSSFETEIQGQSQESHATIEVVKIQMGEFTTLKAGASQDSSVLKFFAEIDEGLNSYNVNIDLLNRGA